MKLLLAALLAVSTPTDVRTLYNTLDPGSVTAALAFYELYPATEEGRKALKRAQELFRAPEDFPLTALIPSINKDILSGNSPLSDSEVEIIERLGQRLPNRALKGYTAQSEQEVLALSSEEIDLGRALLLSQLADEPDVLQKVRHYSALLDLMALQVLSHVSIDASPYDKIKALSRFIFEEKRFRFPPHSIYAKDVDLYTFLPSVMDNHLGVCLGVTALYLAVAQRISLPLEIITPPGHIYVRYRDGEKITNIETTARGVDIPSEHYLGMNNRKLQQRTLKEVIGMTHFNQASVYLQQAKFLEASRCYEKARSYVPSDHFIQELLAYTYLFLDRKSEAKELLKAVYDYLPDEAVARQNISEDYLNGKTDEEGIKAIFQHVDEKRSSILAKLKNLEDILSRYPEFREGIEQCAVAYLQLNRYKEATELLRRYHAIDPGNPNVEYYLAMIYGERGDYKSAWQFLKNAEKITAARDFSPKALRDLRKELFKLCPE